MNQQVRHFKSGRNFIILACIALLSIALHAQFLNNDIVGVHSWRQTQTGWNIRNFYRNDFNILNPRCNKLQADGTMNLNRYEFPAMQWGIAAVQRLLGTEHIVTVRLLIWFLGMASVFGFFRFLRNVFRDDLIAWMGAFSLCFSPLFFYYTINPIPDNLAVCGIIWFFNFFQKYIVWRKNSHLVLAAMFLSLSVAAKLPFIILAAGVPVFLFQQKSWKEWLKLVFVFGLMLLPSFLWYRWVMPGWEGNGVIKGIFDNSISRERVQEILLYHYEIMFPEIIMSNVQTYLFVFAFVVMLFRSKWKLGKFYLYLLPLFFCLLYLAFEFNMINTQHDYYMMPFLVPLFIAITYGLRSLYKLGLVGRLLTVVLLLIMPLRAFHTTKTWWTTEKTYTDAAIYNHKQEFVQAAPSNAPCIILYDISGYIVSYQVDKTGICFGYDELKPEEAKDLVTAKGYRYLYSDSRKTEGMLEENGFLGPLIYEAGSFRVYHLKVPAL